MKKKERSCKICSFKNPKACVTSVIISGKRILLAKRSNEPFKDMWDIPGGYMNEGETPEQAMRREVLEELGIGSYRLRPLGFFPGTASWEGEKFPILSIVYRVHGVMPKDIRIKDPENSELRWFSKKDMPKNVACDANNDMRAAVKKSGFS